MLLILLRAASLVACLSAFGAATFVTLILDHARLQPTVWRLIRISLVAAMALNLAWLLQQTVVMAETATLAELFAALPVVAFNTNFGWAILAREALLILSLLLTVSAPFAAPVLLGTALAVVLQMGMAHALARLDSGDPSLLISETLHLWAAGAWLGGLLPLLICIARLPSADAARLARRFSPLGLVCVLILAATGLLQANELIGSLGNLLHTDYGRAALAKLIVFAVLLAIALTNRFALLERRWLLTVSLLVETGLGAAIIIVAASLASFQPSID